MDYEQIKEIIELFSKCKVDKLKLEMEGWGLELGKHDTTVTVAAAGVPHPVAMPVPVAQAPVAVSEPEEDENWIIVKSPIVGTFYRSPNPTSDPFVEVGDRVKPGQTMCIVEAMKLMNEIQAEVAGEIVKIFPENAHGVEFGQKLFAIKPA